MKKFDAKFMHEKLKIGWTTEQFVRTLEGSEEEFLEFLRKTFSPSTFRSMKADLDKNDKRFQRQMSRAKNKRKEKMELMQKEVVAETTQQTTISEILENLREEEAKLRKELYDQEVVQKDLKNRETELYQSLKSEKEQLLILKTKIEAHKEKVNKIILELNQISENMSDLSDNMTNQRGKLNEVQEDIKSLQKVTIFVYDNDEIDVDCAIDIVGSWNDSDRQKEKFSEILELDAVEMLKVKQIRQLAKILLLVQDLKQKDFEFDITFESHAFEEAYEKLI